MESINIEECNIHHKIQLHKSEKEKLIRPNYIVKLERSFEELKQVEAELSLNITPIETLKSFAQTHHVTKRKDFCQFVGDQCFSRKDLSINQPEMLNFYNKDLQEKVARLYKKDFLAYNPHSALAFFL